jgi:hypothetical protein
LAKKEAPRNRADENGRGIKASKSLPMAPTKPSVKPKASRRPSTNVLSPKKETNVSKKPKRSLSQEKENIAQKVGERKRSANMVRNRSAKRIDMTCGVTDIEYDAD